MLEKLNNINPDFFRSSSQASAYYMKNQSRPQKIRISDTLKHSEAAEFLRLLEWSIDELSLANNKMFVRFTTGGYSFETSIDLDNFSGEMPYVIKAENPRKKELSFSVSLIVYTSVKALKESQYGGKYLMNFSSLQVLFRRVFSLEVENELSTEDSRALDSLLDNIESPLFETLNSISNYLFIFIQKFSGAQLHRGPEPQGNNSVTLRKIKALREY